MALQTYFPAPVRVHPAVDVDVPELVSGRGRFLAGVIAGGVLIVVDVALLVVAVVTW